MLQVSAIPQQGATGGSFEPTGVIVSAYWLLLALLGRAMPSRRSVLLGLATFGGVLTLAGVVSVPGLWHLTPLFVTRVVALYVLSMAAVVAGCQGAAPWPVVAWVEAALLLENWLGTQEAGSDSVVGLLALAILGVALWRSRSERPVLVAATAAWLLHAGWTAPQLTAQSLPASWMWWKPPTALNPLMLAGCTAAACFPRPPSLFIVLTLIGQFAADAPLWGVCVCFVAAMIGLTRVGLNRRHKLGAAAILGLALLLNNAGLIRFALQSPAPDRNFTLQQSFKLSRLAPGDVLPSRALADLFPTDMVRNGVVNTPAFPPLPATRHRLDDPAWLLCSNNPEQVHQHALPVVLCRQQVPPGNGRLFVSHIYLGDHPSTLSIEFANNGPQSATLTIRRRVQVVARLTDPAGSRREPRSGASITLLTI